VKNDVVLLDDGTKELKYQHFSIIMSRSRRMALYTAVNISGSRPVEVSRGNDRWFFDGRIPVELQLGEELYRDNLLDRGHLVRRQDPDWGDAQDAQRANGDTFHFTNCSPQMGAMNQRTWLSLENYILDSARTWREQVTVFTGPVFGRNDYEYRDALIPLAYWKVVVIVTDTGRPSATAYMVDQEEELDYLEFAFGSFSTYQRSIRYIEGLTGLDFGTLRQYDGFSNEEIANVAVYPGGWVEVRIDRPEDIHI
jgi:endonuclease G, mitochondrial